MRAEITISIDVDDDEAVEPFDAASEIKDDGVSFLGQYGSILGARVRMLEGDTVLADTGEPRPPTKAQSRAKARRAVKATQGAQDPDERFRPTAPLDLPEDMDPDEVGYREVDDDNLIDRPAPRPARRKQKGR